MIPRTMITSGPILLMIPPSMSYFRGALRGIRRNCDPQVWLHPFEIRAESMPELRALKARGFIGLINRRDLGDAILELGIPAVNISSTMSEPRFPFVGPDNIAIGSLAAQYLVGRGFQHFAFFGFPQHVYSRDRRRGFMEELKRNGHGMLDAPETSDHSPVSPSETILANRTLVARWLTEAPKPLAVFCANDLRARTLTEAVRAAGLRVPEDVAILGVDNDDVTCALTSPPLSSIAVPDENVGYEAAAVLARMIAGETNVADVRLPPLAVVTRGTTDTLAVDDDDIADAVRFIREHAFESITVEDVLKAVPLSRRWLEHKFERILGRTPAEEIRRLRIERAKDLLATTDLSMPEVARRSGFTNAKHLAASFRGFEDTTPTDYRHAHRQRT